MLDQDTEQFLEQFLPSDWRRQVLALLPDVHPSQVSHVRHKRRTDERVLVAIVTVAKAEKDRREEAAQRVKALIA